MAKTASVTVKITATVRVEGYALAYSLDPADRDALTEDVASYIGGYFDDETATGTITGFTWKRLAMTGTHADPGTITVVIKIKAKVDTARYADTYGCHTFEAKESAAYYIGNTFSRQRDALGSGSFTDITWVQQAR